jgi:hypothetical protein
MGISSLFEKFGIRQQLPINNGFTNMLGKFQDFQRSFNGDAQQEVQRLLNSGQMSQQQFNQLSQMATQFQQMLRRK